MPVIIIRKVGGGIRPIAVGHTGKNVLVPAHSPLWVTSKYHYNLAVKCLWDASLCQPLLLMQPDPWPDATEIRF